MYTLNFKDYILDTNSKSSLRFKMYLSEIIPKLPNKTKSYTTIHKILNEHYLLQQKEFRFSTKEKIFKDVWLEYYKTKLERNF